MMFQDIAPHVYDNSFQKRTAQPEDFVCIFRERELLCRPEGDHIVLPRLRDMPEIRSYDCTYAFSIDDSCYFLVRDRRIAEQPAWHFAPTGDLPGVPGDPTLFAAKTAESLWRWYRANRFCGSCGSENIESDTERAFVCPDCRRVIYPRIDPCVIVAVTDGDRLLLTRYTGRAFKRYALVAGYCEIGEPAEQTVRREVLEETGLHVKNLRFYKSQPWVYTDTLLLGFYCDLDGSDQVTLQADELCEGTWFRREEIPEDHSGISLTGEMIETFRQGKEPK